MDLTIKKFDLDILLLVEKCTMYLEVTGSEKAPFLISFKTTWMTLTSYLEPGMTQSFIRVGSSKTSNSPMSQQFILKFENNDYSLAGGRISITQSYDKDISLCDYNMTLISCDDR